MLSCRAVLFGKQLIIVFLDENETFESTTHIAVINVILQLKFIFILVSFCCIMFKKSDSNVQNNKMKNSKVDVQNTYTKTDNEFFFSFYHIFPLLNQDTQAFYLLETIKLIPIMNCFQHRVQKFKRGIWQVNLYCNIRVHTVQSAKCFYAILGSLYLNMRLLIGKKNINKCA